VLIISEWTLDIGEELRVLHRLAEGNWTCEVDHINAESKGNWYRLARRKIYQEIVQRSEY
jgi:hypothetical protein